LLDYLLTTPLGKHYFIDVLGLSNYLAGGGVGMSVDFTSWTPEQLEARLKRNKQRRRRLVPYTIVLAILIFFGILQLLFGDTPSLVDILVGVVWVPVMGFVLFFLVSFTWDIHLEIGELKELLDSRPIPVADPLGIRDKLK
jgi:hypothetical protein